MLKRLASIHLALALIVFIIILCLLATLIPQNMAADFYTATYGPLWGKLITTLALDELYTSWWLKAAGVLFALNLSVCTFLRLRWAAAFNRRTHRLFAWGSPILHLGLCLILLGSAISILWGQETYVEIPVGETAAFELGPADLTLTVKDFTIDYADDGLTPEQYTSQIRAEGNGQQAELTAAVNHPAAFQGVKLYQSAYGQSISLALETPQATRELTVKEHEWVTLDASEQLMLAVRLDPNSTGHTPRLAIMLAKDQVPVASQLLTLGQGWPLSDELTLRFTDARFYTGLTAKYDRGIAIIFTGFVVLIIGLLLRFWPSEANVIAPTAPHPVKEDKS